MSGLESESAGRSLKGAAELQQSTKALSTVGRYAVVHMLGRGGMGSVFLARDPQLQRLVAIKLLTDRGLTTREALQRFQTEARAIARVNHPNIATVYEIGEDQDHPFLVMEYLPGGTLSERLRQQLPSPATAAAFLETLARAIHSAHECGIIHRDLKPSNVLFAEDNSLKITDFGMAKRIDVEEHSTLTGQILGTPSYMAPEQAGGVVKNIGRECDVYALGAMLYELLTGRPPFQSSDPVETILLLLSSEPISVLRLQPQSPRDLATICMKCLEKSPRRRYSTALGLADDLARFRQGFPIQARPVRRLERAWRWAKRNPSKASLWTVVAASVMTLLVGGIWYNARLQRELDRSNKFVADGRDFAQWVLGEHMPAVATLAGSTEIQANLVSELLDYLDGLAATAANDDPLVPTIARAYFRISIIQGSPDDSNLGDTAGALESASKADLLYRRAILAAPSDPELKLAQIACRRLIIQLRRVSGEAIDARHDLHVLRGALESIEGQLPDPQRGQMIGLLLASDLAWIDLEEGNLAAAARQLAEAVTAAQAIVEQFPEDELFPSTLRSIRTHLVHAHELQGDYRKALDQIGPLVGQSHSDVANYPTNATFRQRLASELIQQGDLFALLRQDDESLSAFREAEKIRRDLLSLDPKNAKLDRDLISSLDRVAGALVQKQEFSAALEVLVDGFDRLQSLLQRDSRNVDLRRMVWVLKNRLALVAMRKREIDLSLATLKEALAVELELVALDDSRVDDWNGIAETYHYLAMALMSRPVEQQAEGDLRQAIQYVDKSLAAFEEILSRGNLSAAQQHKRQAVEKTEQVLRQALDALDELSQDLDRW